MERLRTLGRLASPPRAAALGLAWLVCQPGEAAAQSGITDRIDLRGIATVETAIEFDGDGFQKGDFVLEPEGDIDLGAFGDLTFIGRLRVDPVDELEPGRVDDQDGVRSVVSRRAFIGDAADFELRELYLDNYFGNVFLRLGKQQVVWGEADGLRVLDVVNPLQFREFIIGDFEDRRIPTWMANVEATFGSVTAQFLWIPDHTYDEVPEPGAVFEITSPRFGPTVPEGFAGTVALAEPDRPDRFIEDDDYGARINAFIGGWDLSLNYLYHFRDEQVLRRSGDASGDILIEPEYERSHLIGATASNAFGKFTLRSEVGYSTNRFFLTNDPLDEDGVFESDEISYVLGVDYQYDADTLISGQIFQSYLTDAGDAGVRDDLDTTLSLLVSREFRNDTIVAEALYLQSVNDGDGLLQIDFSYELRSNLKLLAGADVFFGDADGVFGQFDGADRIRFGFEYGF